jgi:hypothetical protein
MTGLELVAESRSVVLFLSGEGSCLVIVEAVREQVA